MAIFTRATLPTAYWFKIKVQYFSIHLFPFIDVAHSLRPHARWTHTQLGVRSCALASSFSLVVNNVLVAILRLLTHSQPINQTIQLAYDHNKYAPDKFFCSRENDPTVFQRRLRPEGQIWQFINQSAFTSRQTYHPYKALYRQVPCVVGCYINNII